ncbi:hypothetical protein [Novosphingobium gossypii]|uniref:hypothetical protein n=1 Tax=Novosphingobium gossypii TaxID=1604774 RepID=UPI003D23DEB3
MTTYPLEAGEAEPFVPASLEHLTNPPTFFLRWGTPREKEQQRRVMDEEGAVTYASETMRAEILRGMRELLGPEDFDLWQPQVKGWWDAVDAYEAENKDVPVAERDPLVYEDQDVVSEVLEQIARDWRPYRLMQADNNEYQRKLHHAINSAIVVSFDNLDTAVIKRGRYLTFDCLLNVADRLDKYGAKHAPGSALRPSQELSIECMKRLFLDKASEGNSDSPVPSEATPDTSKTGTGEKNGKLTGSARSRKTPARSSAKQSGR